MKNILKKIGVFGIILAMVIPFIEMPQVKAEGDCTTHLQNYLFLDVDSLESYGGNGYTTYALFYKNFAAGNVKVKSIKSNFVNEPDDDTLFWQLYTATLVRPRAYEKYTNDFAGYLFTQQDVDKYEDVTTLVHAYWGKYDENGRPIETDWQGTAASLTGATNSTLQKKGGMVFSKDNVTVMPAVYEDSAFSTSSETDLIKYFERMANDEEETYIPLQITRKFTSAQLNKKYGVKLADNTYKIYGSNGSYSDYTSCTNLNTCLNAGTNVDVLTHEGGIEQTNEVHYYWPFILSVEYEVCANNESEKEWTLAYDLNVDDDSASNRPDPETKVLGKSIEVSSTVPKRNGYKFLKWCDDRKGTGTCYKAGDKVESPNEAKTIPLFAQWGSTKEGDPEKTGVISYVIGFISVGLIAGGLYILAKKKNLFRQI